MIINKVEIGNLDIYDADVAESYENALAEIEKKAEVAEKETKISVCIRKQCEAIFDCFNSLFGEGTDVKIFGGKTNLIVCLKAVDELATQVNEQKNEFEKMFDKYSPNRAQRRSKK